MLKQSDFHDLFKVADALYDDAKYDEALNAYSGIISKYPERAETYINLGNCYDALGDKLRAKDYYEKALGIDTANVIAWGNLGGALYELGDYEASKDASKKALDINPDYEMALVNLGNAYDMLGDKEHARISYEKAIVANPDYAVAHNNLGNVLYDIGLYVEAEKASSKAIELDGSDITAYITLGNALDALGRYQESIDAYKIAIEMDENYAIAYTNIGGVYEKIDMIDEAEAAYWMALCLEEKEDDSSHLNYGYVLYDYAMKGELEKAEELGKKWLAKFPHNSVAKHMVASLHDDAEVKRASDDYVKKLFDAFAPDFDESLAAIEYKAPQLIGDMLDVYYNGREGTLDILDAGCGTGLCGNYAHKYSSKLDGVDLSAGMLVKAKERNIYNTLFEDELEHFLNDLNTCYDVVVSSDVLTYIGDLSEVFKGFAKALKEDGRLIFTISKNDKESKKGYFLHSSGRFTHNDWYVKDSLKECGLSVVEFKETVLRLEGGEPVIGFLCVAEK